MWKKGFLYSSEEYALKIVLNTELRTFDGRRMHDLYF